MKHDNDGSKSEDADWEHPPEIPHINVESREARPKRHGKAAPLEQLQSLSAEAYEAIEKVNSYEKALENPNWIEAIKEELESIKDRKVWMEMNEKDVPSGMKTLGTRWVFTVKHNNGDIKYKARLVVLGRYQRPGVDFTETYSPVAADSTIRILLSLANYKGWEVKQIDVEKAFLNAKLKEDVYLKRPKGYDMEEGKVLKLNRALYGLVQAPKAWMTTFTKQLETLGYKRSWTDPCLMTKSNQGEVILIITIYVDDCLIAGKEEDVEETIQGIEKAFKVKRIGDAKRYLGYMISRDRDRGTLKIHQTEYIQNIQMNYRVEAVKAIETPGKVGNEPQEDKDDILENVDLKE